MSTQKRTNFKENVQLLNRFEMYPPTDWQWLATVNNPTKPAFITLYAFKPGKEPEVYFMWLNDWDSILYWLHYLYHFADVKPHILNAIYSVNFPNRLFQKAIKILEKLKCNPPNILIQNF